MCFQLNFVDVVLFFKNKYEKLRVVKQEYV